jgi:hypothetical protein
MPPKEEYVEKLREASRSLMDAAGMDEDYQGDMLGEGYREGMLHSVQTLLSVLIERCTTELR